MSVKPFDVSGWFPLHNAVVDMIMPRLSSSAFKVLMVTIRQTHGWVRQVGGDPHLRKESDVISYSQFLEKTGIKSSATLSKALKECLAGGYLLRRQVGVGRGFKKPIFAYALNVGLVLTDDLEYVLASDSEVTLASDSEVTVALDSEDTKQRKQQEPVVAVLSEQQQQALSSLQNFGVAGALALVQQSEPEHVLAWIEYAKGKTTIRDKAAFVASMLRRGEQAPGDGYTETPEDRAARERCERYERYASDAARYERQMAAAGDETKASPLRDSTIWDHALVQLGLQMTKATFDTWLKGTTLVSQGDGTVAVACPDDTVKQWLQDRIATMAERALAGIVGEAVSVEFVVKGD